MKILTMSRVFYHSSSSKSSSSSHSSSSESSSSSIIIFHLHIFSVRSEDMVEIFKDYHTSVVEKSVMSRCNGISYPSYFTRFAVREATGSSMPEVMYAQHMFGEL